MNQLTLILPNRLLIEFIRRLETVARQEQVQVKGVLCVRTVIYAVEDVHRRAAIMQHSELRRIEKATRALEVKGHEVPSFSVAVGQRRIFMGRAESAVQCIETARRLFLVEAGARAGVN